MTGTLNKKQLGDLSEQRACDFLITKGLQILTRNYRTRFGEIDLIMQEKNGEVVFVEVRNRSLSDFENAIESVSWNKQQKIIKTAMHYLEEQDLTNKVNCRFDIIGFSENHFDWIKDAFFYD